MAKYYSSTLQKGSKGDETKEWQTFLNSQGYNLAVDGDFGDLTTNATIDWQTKNGLTADGIVGENTWSKAGYTLSPSSQDWSYGDFNYDDFTYEDYEEGEDFTYEDYEAPDAFEYEEFDKGEDFTYDEFSYDDYTESDAVKGAGDALNAHNANKPGEYQSQWQTQLDGLMNQIMNREKFSYDLNGDALYQQYKDKYIQQGKLAMADTMGQAAAMTGGYGSSYAQNVGQQAYQGQLDNLNDVVPELYAMALDKYNREGQDLYNQYGMVMDRENQDYGRYRDTVSDFYTDRDYLAGRYDSERNYDYSKYVNDRNFAYGKYSDDRNFNYTNYINDLNFRYGQYSDDRSLAYSQYESDRAFGYNQYVNDRNFAYGQWSDDRTFDYNKYIADRSLAYDKYSSDRSLAYDEYATDKNLSYEEYRAAIADEQWAKSFAEDQRQFNEQMAASSATSGGSGDGKDSTSPVTDYDNGSLSEDQIKAIQKAMGVTVDGKWGPESSKAAGGLSPEEAYKKYVGEEQPKQVTSTQATTSFIGTHTTQYEYLQRGGGRTLAQFQDYIKKEIEKATNLTDEEVEYLVRHYGLA